MPRLRFLKNPPSEFPQAKWSKKTQAQTTKSTAESSNGGTKHDQNKPRIDLIPSEALEELGKVLSFGAQKYSEGNWANGIRNSRLVAASLRHILAYNRGEDLDPESGLSHISHGLCNLMFLSWNIINRPELDDRWILNVQKRT